MSKKTSIFVYIVVLLFVILTSVLIYVTYFPLHIEPYNTMTIPKVIMQTAKEKPENYIIEKFNTICPKWEYIHFNDEEIREFFRENPLTEFPNITTKFNSIKNGAHKADLFRYYYIYVKGGVFIDSDAMLEKNLDDVLGNCQFFSVGSANIHPDTIFQGLIGAVPNNEIIYKALVDAYNINDKDLADDYLVLTRNLYNIIYQGKSNYEENYDFKIKLFQERWIEGAQMPTSEIYDPITQEVILKHYCVSKVIPK